MTQSSSLTRWEQVVTCVLCCNVPAASADSPRWRHRTAAPTRRAAWRRDRALAAASGTSAPRLCSRPRSSRSPVCWRGNLPAQRERKAAWSFTGRFDVSYRKKGLSVLVLPCSSACSTSDTQGDSRVSLNKNRHHASVGWTWNVYLFLLDSTGCMCD